jgi:hypothetical protein
MRAYVVAVELLEFIGVLLLISTIAARLILLRKSISKICGLIFNPVFMDLMECSQEP